MGDVQYPTAAQRHIWRYKVLTRPAAGSRDTT